MKDKIAIETMVDRWESADRPPFKGRLIDTDGCCCAQGDVLRCAGYSDDWLRATDQRAADRAVAALLGISVTHSVLLRQVNDKSDGCPQDVLSAPEKILGPEARRVLAFWKRLDNMSDAAGDAAGAAARAAAGAAAWDAAWAAHEIQGHSLLKSLFFLPMFGIRAIEDLDTEG